MKKAGVRGQKLLKMRKPAHAKKVCGRIMTILLVSAYQTVLKKARSGPTTGAPAYGELTHISTRRAAETSIHIGAVHESVCACLRIKSGVREKNIEANDSARSPKFLAPAIWPDRNCRLFERPDESTAAVKAAEMFSPEAPRMGHASGGAPGLYAPSPGR